METQNLCACVCVLGCVYVRECVCVRGWMWMDFCDHQISRCLSSSILDTAVFKCISSRLLSLFLLYGTCGLHCMVWKSSTYFIKHRSGSPVPLLSSTPTITFLTLYFLLLFTSVLFTFHFSLLDFSGSSVFHLVFLKI